MKAPRFVSLCLIPTLALLAACAGDDRSGEQPFKPTVITFDTYVQTGDSILLTGQVAATPNSAVTACGFVYWNDTLKANKRANETTEIFQAHTDSLGEGTYSFAAYATNGMGTSYGDTLTFEKH
ncbi:MAG: hypothetical protein J6M53_07635 [Bacteroidaceae bacterium]|nr:hypothetical protein [Bacteroidaceae bacterium]